MRGRSRAAGAPPCEGSSLLTAHGRRILRAAPGCSCASTWSVVERESWSSPRSREWACNRAAGPCGRPSRAGSGRAHVGRTSCGPAHRARPVSRTVSAGPLVESSAAAPAAAATSRRRRRRRRTESGCPLMVPPAACCRSAGTAASAGAGLRARDGLLGNLLGGPFRRRTATDGAHRLVVEPRLPQVSAAFRAAIWKERGSATGSDHVPDLVMPMPKTGAVGWAASPMHGSPARSQQSSRASSSSEQVRACPRSASREDGPCESGHATLRAFGAALGVAPVWG